MCVKEEERRKTEQLDSAQVAITDPSKGKGKRKKFDKGSVEGNKSTSVTKIDKKSSSGTKGCSGPNCHCRRAKSDLGKEGDFRDPDFYIKRESSQTAASPDVMGNRQAQVSSFFSKSDVSRVSTAMHDLIVVQSGGKNIEVDVMTKKHGLRQLDEAEIDAIVAEIEAEKAAAGAAKKAPVRES
ncbi:hypothetical protein RJ640_016879 [Escallonia rubra]|uniref:Uncharacterized protein n=1 Tax=Escallonia rubra TaxID=112253 RepID=A0AA88QJR0_9ASTE|nr:hypothetical protein RJ640_016879 [Escallonia rubra]